MMEINQLLTLHARILSMPEDPWAFKLLRKPWPRHLAKDLKDRLSAESSRLKIENGPWYLAESSNHPDVRGRFLLCAESVAAHAGDLSDTPITNLLQRIYMGKYVEDLRQVLADECERLINQALRRKARRDREIALSTLSVHNSAAARRSNGHSSSEADLFGSAQVSLGTADAVQNRMWFGRVGVRYLQKHNKRLTYSVLSRAACYETTWNKDVAAWLKGQPRSGKADLRIRKVLRVIESDCT